MHKFITVEYPYDEITLQFPKIVKHPFPLKPAQWAALERAERRLYRDDPGCHGWTDVNENDGSDLINQLWEQAGYGVEAIINEGSDNPDVLMARTAARVAQALAVVSFGSEFLLK